MAGLRRPAAYIRIGWGCGADTLATQQLAIFQAAREHGWPDPAVYLDIDSADTGQAVRIGQVASIGQLASIGRTAGFGLGTGQALARLTAAISTGQYDALILGGIGTIRSSRADLTRLLAVCTRHGVSVECARPVPAGSDKPRQGQG